MGGVALVGQTSDGSSDQVPVPDWGAWRSAATVVITGNHTFSGGSYSGIWYVDGNVTINSSVMISGTVIATGNIDYSNSASIAIVSGPSNTALIAGNNIIGNRAASVFISGLVYAANNIVINNESSIFFYGIIFAGNNINSNGSASMALSYNSDLAVHFPYYFTDPDGIGLKVSTWK
jgi:hypothetical protein